MGTLAQQANGRQLAAMNPMQNLQSLLAKSWPRIASVIGNNMSPERLYQMCVSSINHEPKLAECTPESVLSCFMRCSSLGLEPSDVDGLGKAYILPYGNKNFKTGRREAVLIVGYRGMIELARRSGELKSIHTQAVYKGDEFSHWEDETGQHFKFAANPDAKHSPENLTHVYMNAQLTNGGFVFEVMTKNEVEAIKRRSSAGDKGPWKSDYEAMAKKTVVRRSFPYLPVSVQAQEAASVDEQTPDYSDIFHPVIESSSTPAIEASHSESSQETSTQPSLDEAAPHE